MSELCWIEMVNKFERCNGECDSPSPNADDDQALIRSLPMGSSSVPKSVAIDVIENVSPISTPSSPRFHFDPDRNYKLASSRNTAATGRR